MLAAAVLVGATVFKSSTRPFPDRIGLAHVDSYSSDAGIPIFKDHEYELVSVYQNITDRDQDSMAVMDLYMLDKDFAPAGRPPGTEPGFEPLVVEPAVDGAPAVAQDAAGAPSR